MATFTKDFVLKRGSVAEFGRKENCWKLYESDSGFHSINSPAEDQSLVTSLHIENVRLVWQRDWENRPTNREASRRLERASHFGDLPGATKAIADGADVNYVDTDSTMAIMHRAAQQGHAVVVKLLLENGANPNVHNPVGNTPLMLAARSGRLEAVVALVAGGANVNQKDKNGGTALDNASDHPEVQRFLRTKGATASANL